MGEFADYIHAKDVQQNTPATARVCQVDSAHGRLTMRGDGQALVCARFLGVKDNKVVCCAYAEAVGRG